MILTSRFIFGFFAWLGLEFAAFVAVAENIGFSGALLLGMATSLAGFVLLRQTGQGAIEHLLASISGARPRRGDMVDGLIRALAAFLLIIPGFISDLVGLALAAPSVRQILARRFGGEGLSGAPRRRESPGIIDLAPEEWVSCDRPVETLRR
ncbi:FxsA family protein [uncultured Rhodoblastus sp.]|uniref:FxsA family protein n=1 Tax=uncultured Rhodoblastus sp. TaxID=543037 RepID=UPI0025F399FC|nr:FxsA family protein [uncultured Rhodoblastus sp.]